MQIIDQFKRTATSEAFDREMFGYTDPDTEATQTEADYRLMQNFNKFPKINSAELVNEDYAGV